MKHKHCNLKVKTNIIQLLKKIILLVHKISFILFISCASSSWSCNYLDHFCKTQFVNFLWKLEVSDNFGTTDINFLKSAEFIVHFSHYTCLLLLFVLSKLSCSNVEA